MRTSILIAALALTSAFVTARADEAPEAAPEYRELNRDAEELRRDNERLWREIKDESDNLNIRIDDIHKTITQHSTVLSTLILVVIGLVGGLSVFFTIKHELNVRALRKSVEDEVKIIKDINLEARRKLREIKEYAEENKKIFDTLISDAKGKIAGLLKETRRGKDDKEQKIIYEEHFEEDPSVKRDLSLLYSAAISGEITDKKELDDISAALYYNEEYEKAIKIYRLILDIEPDNIEVRNALGWALILTGDFYQAINELNIVEVTNSDYGITYLNRARAYSKLGFKEKMLADLRRFIGLREDWREQILTSDIFDEYSHDPDLRRLVFPDEFEGEGKA